MNKTLEIIEHKDRTFFTVNVPFSFRSTLINLSKERQFRIAADSTRVQLSTVAALIEYFGAMLIDDEIGAEKAGGFIALLGVLTGGLNEALESLEMELKREEKPGKEQPLDLSNASIESLSIKLSEIVQNPFLPPEIQACITDRLSESNKSPEAIKDALLNLQNKEGAK